MKTFRVKGEFNHSMIDDLYKMHGLDSSIEDILVKKMAMVIPRVNKIEKIIKKLNNKDF